MKQCIFEGVKLLIIWLVIHTSAMMLADKWDVEKLRKQLHDPSKERIDLACDACVIMVDAIQYLARLNSSEDDVATVITKLCKFLKIEKDPLICSQGVQEFKVSSRYAC